VSPTCRVLSHWYIQFKEAGTVAMVIEEFDGAAIEATSSEGGEAGEPCELKLSSAANIL
jgi:hypothetical protein